MSLIDQFISQYDKEFDFYQKLSQIIAGKIEDELTKRGVKAIVTFRAKRPERLKDKLLKRNKNNKYASIKDIQKDIIDLSGIRIALYFPSERDIIDEIVNQLFIVEKTKTFPDSAHTPNPQKRFSGYWATHYRVKLKPDSIDSRYTNTLSEIQVASVLMHAWSEVEHDLVYKPFSGELSKEELTILDQINGLVISGEIALEQLQSAMAERTKQKDEITDKYELTNYLLAALNNTYENKIKIGDNYLLNNYLSSIDKLHAATFEDLLSQLNTDTAESATDQLLDLLLLHNSSSSINLKKYFKNLQFSDRKASAFEAFVKCWVLIEKAFREILNQENIHTKKHSIPDFGFLQEREILNKAEIEELMHIKKIRNNLLHGVETPSDNTLSQFFEILRNLTRTVIGKINDTGIKDKLIEELNELK